MGSDTDLFNYDDQIGDEKDEFSYSSNPSSFGREWDYEHVGPMYITDPQSIPNSVNIKIVGEVGDGVYLDISFAPKQEIIAPTADDFLMIDQPFVFTWDTAGSIADPNGIIDLVDIYFDKGDGSPETTIASGVPDSQGFFIWTPTASEVTNTGRIRMVFHNINDSEHVGEGWSDGTFTILVPSIMYVPPPNPVNDTGLDYPGTPYSSVVWNFNDDEFKD